MANDFFQDMKARAARMLLEAEEHAATCKASRCVQCRRFGCSKCDAPQDFEGLCDSCRRESARSRWATQAIAAVPRAFSEARLDAPWLVRLVGQKTIDEARAALAESRVVAIGPPGAGKTSLLAAMLIAAEFEGNRPSLLWVSAHQLAKARTLHPLGEGEAPLVARALEVNVLVVDELGGEDQRYASSVTEVLFERHAQEQPTWITSGVGPKEITDRYGSGIARRVFEDAKVFRLVGRPR